MNTCKFTRVAPGFWERAVFPGFGRFGLLPIILALLALGAHLPPAGHRQLQWRYMPIEEFTYYEIWRSTNLPGGFVYWAHTTNTYFPLPFDFPKEFFRVRVVAPSGTSDWATVE